MNLQALVTDVQALTQKRLSQYIEELRELCSIDSPGTNKPGLDTMAAYIAARMRGLGMEVTLVEHEHWGNDVLGVIHGDGVGKIELLGHMDTVYPVGTAAARPLRREGEILYGPGVCDMKGCLLAALYAIEGLLAAGHRSFEEIRLLCVSDEETSGARHSIDLIQQVSQGCNGALVLEAARANGDIVSARKGDAWYTLTAHGRAAHSGVEPEKGRNAIEEVAYQLLQFKGLNGWREGLHINPGVIVGGTAPNIIPDTAQVQFDVRFMRSEDRIATEQHWREMLLHPHIADVTLTLEMAPGPKPPMEESLGSIKLVRSAQEVARLLGFSLGHTLTGGASDGSYVSALGIPTLDGLGPIGGHDHSPGEYLVATSVAPRTALLAGLLATISVDEL